MGKGRNSKKNEEESVMIEIISFVFGENLLGNPITIIYLSYGKYDQLDLSTESRRV